MTEVIDYYNNGLPSAIGSINEDGQQTGLWKFFHENGALYSEGEFKNGEYVGIWTEWYSNGQIKCKTVDLTMISPSDENVIIYEFWDEAGNQIIEDGNGILFEYFPDKNIKGEYHFKNGLKNGEHIEYYPNGQLFLKRNFLKGKKNGESILYFENGVIQIFSEYRNGNNHGKWLEYYADGKLKEESFYVENVYNPVNFWDENKNQLLINGSGKKIEKYGASEADIYEIYYENGKFLKEIKIASLQYGKFIPNSF